MKKTIALLISLMMCLSIIAGCNSPQVPLPRPTPTHSPAPFPAASPSPAPTPGLTQLGPGQTRVTGATEFSFTPTESGVWEFRTSDTSDGDPTITIFDGDTEIAYDDDSAGEFDALIDIFLDAYTTYTVVVGFWWNEEGSTTLTVSRIAAEPGDDIVVIGSEGFQIDGVTEFHFTPNVAGV